ncbi:MAG: DNA mismatch repair protein, partial [Muribaculaceae bacterium]|nr:DNA mismatch repair protein [Muribaculaceae bacterium]
GFIASVEKPSMLKIRGSEEKVSVDLYVNGRLREKDIVKHVPTARIVESYLYGQVHYNALDDETDRFTSSREGVVSDDPKFKDFLLDIEKIIKIIIEDWDVWRAELKQDGDSENARFTRKERKSKELFDAVVEEFIPPALGAASGTGSSSRHKVEQWIDELHQDAAFNFSSYGECFVAENLLRKYIGDKKIAYKDFLTEEINKCKEAEKRNKEAANISIEIRKNNSDLTYASMTNLAKNVDSTGTPTTVVQDAKEFKPIRDALAHTSLLTDEAKHKLTSVFYNIKGRIIQLLNKA